MNNKVSYAIALFDSYIWLAWRCWLIFSNSISKGSYKHKVTRAYNALVLMHYCFDSLFLVCVVYWNIISKS